MSHNLIQEIKINKVSSKKKLFPIKNVEKKIVPEEKVEMKKVYKFPKIRQDNSKRRKKVIFTIGFVILILGLLFYLATYFSFTKIVISPQTHKMELSKENFIAQKNSDSALNFEIVILSDQAKKDVSFSESKNSPLFASGQVVIYNEFSTKFQKLSIHTKLADNNGLIYLTNEAVVVPGYTLSSAKKIIPGSVTVGVTAQVAGSKYNGAKRDFSIVGFKGTAKGEKIYARSKTEISGGSTGLVYSLGASDLGDLNAQASSTFKIAMMKKIQAQVPANYILFPDATTFSYKIDENSNSQAPTGQVKIDGVLSAVIFKRDTISNAIIHRVLQLDKMANPNISQQDISSGDKTLATKEIEIQGLDALNFSFNDPNQLITKDTQAISFNVSGSGNLLWHSNLTSLKNNLVGVSKEIAQKVLSGDPSISSYTVNIFPPWESYLPNTVNKIKIIIK